MGLRFKCKATQVGLVNKGDRDCLWRSGWFKNRNFSVTYLLNSPKCERDFYLASLSR